ncbi:acyl-CoA dehydrogenase family protein [Geodermatophilus sp. YIM 151500]|uniref:acyl-CoA dehydrogenase family protein n=1 Tax=Geodermatophilus sp. YIM 151500 TaxID=2984531 RepID=UPI0021E47F75|nr:acyl-CoA dehydrogenase family protein [Geodermatophilus sp. YIM 151500]MCV2491384.1 acyl-CoA dehydrogenase family protein [Geodermatophilus sp. YIM 151500]
MVAVEEGRLAAARAFTILVDGGWAPPLPGTGATLARWQALAALGERDLSLARLAEGHADALAVLAELGGPAVPAGCRLGVWAAEPPDARLVARGAGGGWRLSGRKAWCSGARTLTHALVTAATDDGPRLFLLDLAAGGVRVDATVWRGPGMAAADTADVHLDDVPADPVGPVGGYTGRPGFWHGGIGVAAVWTGGARAVATRLTAAGDGDPFVSAALGAADVELHGVDAALRVAAAEVDAGPGDLPAARVRAMRVRALAARGAEDVLRLVGHALGPGPLAHDAEHARRVADLTVYLRQHHAERELAALGDLLRGARPDAAAADRGRPA